MREGRQLGRHHSWKTRLPCSVRLQQPRAALSAAELVDTPVLLSVIYPRPYTAV